MPTTKTMNVDYEPMPFIRAENHSLVSELLSKQDVLIANTGRIICMNYTKWLYYIQSVREKALTLELTAAFFTLLNSLPQKKSHGSNVRTRKSVCQEIPM